MSTSSTFRQYVSDAIANAGIPSYDVGPKVNRVIDSCVLREETAVNRLREAAISLGLSEDRFEDLMIEAGLLARDPEPEPEVVDHVTQDSEDDEAPSWFSRAMKSVTDRLDRAGL